MSTPSPLPTPDEVAAMVDKLRAAQIETYYRRAADMLEALAARVRFLDPIAVAASKAVETFARQRPRFREIMGDNPRLQMVEVAIGEIRESLQSLPPAPAESRRVEP